MIKNKGNGIRNEKLAEKEPDCGFYSVFFCDGSGCRKAWTINEVKKKKRDPVEHGER